MTDDRQRLRREAVDLVALESSAAKLNGESFGDRVHDVLDAVELVVPRLREAEATIATQAKEIERLRAYWLRHKAPDEVSP